MDMVLLQKSSFWKKVNALCWKARKLTRTDLKFCWNLTVTSILHQLNWTKGRTVALRTCVVAAACSENRVTAKPLLFQHRTSYLLNRCCGDAKHCEEVRTGLTSIITHSKCTINFLCLCSVATFSCNAISIQFVEISVFLRSAAK